jgi:DNA helicase-2/ATP-dependent DNA helicase PcrA
MSDALALIPKVTDKDIEWVSDLMRLRTLDERRRAFLTARSTLDVSACPGSGKTTLVVAKLMILAKKWPHRTKGICVLSHTNAARREIEGCLRGTVIGQRLLTYPHFVGTIHGFVNRFLAVPRLRAHGHQSPVIDDDATTAYRRRMLGEDHHKVRWFLELRKRGLDELRICTRDLVFNLAGREFPAGSNSDTFKLTKRAVEATAQAGFFCHDEMLVWGRALLEDFPSAASWLRRRFPVILVDEMQDTSRTQGALLHAVFPRKCLDIAVQRIGDANQAIFDWDDTEPNTSDPFPDSDRHLEIHDSYRFGPEIASLASPFAAKPVGPAGLHGIGPRPIAGAPSAGPHAIFVFPDDSTAGVLDAYSRHVLAVFDDSALTGEVVTAVGAVHKKAECVSPGEKKYPLSVAHYWDGYIPEVTGKRQRPDSLAQCVRVARAIAWVNRDISLGIDFFVVDLVRLALQIGDIGELKRKHRTHRVILELLRKTPMAFEAYRRLLRVVFSERVPLTKPTWDAMREDALTVACALCDGKARQWDASNFLRRPDDTPLVLGASDWSPQARSNTYRVAVGDRDVDIRLGSIHSVKGQTHLATMVLDTFWYERFSEAMLPWLLGERYNRSGPRKQDTKRRLQAYVAMTRPSHLVCLAVRRSTFGENLGVHRATLEARGWLVVEIADGTVRSSL